MQSTGESYLFAHHLYHLILNDNFLTVIPLGCFAALKYLHYLELNGNRLTILSGSYDQASIQVLDISMNHVQYISAEFLNGMQKLQRINVSGNSLNDININTVYAMSKISYLYTDDVRFCCIASHIDICSTYFDTSMSSCSDLIAATVNKMLVWVTAIVCIFCNGCNCVHILQWHFICLSS